MSEIITSDARTWAEFVWPDWVPVEVRKQIEDFWTDEWGRGPQEWLEDHSAQGAPPSGTVVTLPKGCGSHTPLVIGRFVFAWNNIARLVHDDGTWSYTYFSDSLLRDPESYRRKYLESLRTEMTELESRMAELRAKERAMVGGPVGEGVVQESNGGTRA